VSSTSTAFTKFAIFCVSYVMRVHYTFIVSLFLRPWSFMDFRGLFCIVDLRPLTLSSSFVLLTILFGLWFFCAMLDSLDVPSFWQHIFFLWVCVFLWCAVCCIVIDLRTFFTIELLLLWASVLWSFVTYYFSSGRLPVCVDLFFDRLWLDSIGFETLHAMTTLKMCILDYLFLFVVLSFFKWKMLLHTLCIWEGC
jgi:hypothetical protein